MYKLKRPRTRRVRMRRRGRSRNLGNHLHRETRAANWSLMIRDLTIAIPIVGVIAALTIAPVAPEASNAIFVAASTIGFLLSWPQALTELNRPIVWMPLLGLFLTGLAYFISAGIAGLAGLMYFLPLLCILPLVTLARNVERELFSGLVGLLALCGVVSAAIMAANEVRLTGTNRAGLFIANPIHFADVVLLVGLVGLVGVPSSRGWLRVVMAASPLVSIYPVALSGTRGAMVAVVAAFASFTIAAFWVRLAPRRLIVLGAIGLAILAGLFIVLGGGQLSGVQRVLSDITATLTDGAPADEATNLRLQMYLGGIRAFMEAPIFGHGPIEFTVVADRLADVSFGGSPHLHNDIVDMAASGGFFGVAAFMLFVGAPLVEAIRAPEWEGKPWMVAIAVTQVLAFVVMGLTNAMFGILTVTVTFTTICVLTSVLALPPRALVSSTLRVKAKHVESRE